MDVKWDPEKQSLDEALKIEPPEPLDITIFKPENPSITFQADNGWVMRITKGRIVFNRENFPDLCEDEFAYGVLKILEKARVIEIDNSQWDNGRIKIDK